MKEFKFWALPYSQMQMFLIALPAGIVFLVPLFSIDRVKYFEYLFAGAFAWNLFFFLAFLKRVRISFSESGTIHLYVNGKEKIVAEPQQFEYVRGIDVNSTTNQSTLYLVFNGKDFTFSFFENRSFGSSKQQELLQYMVTTYNLEKELYKKSLMATTYTYRNPAFKGVSVANYNKSEK
ncbi:hypothetical protein [Dysgonomonas reticulitermitis]